MDVHATPRERMGTGAVGPAGGLTLLELLAALAITLLVTLGAVPAFHQTIRQAELDAEARRLLSSLHLARSEAIRRQRPVVLCPSANGTGCGPDTAWAAGWLVFADTDSDRRPGPADARLRVEGAVEDGFTLTAGRRRRVLFQPLGVAPGHNAGFRLCDPDGAAAPRVVCLAATGRARLSGEACGGGPPDCP